MNNLCPICKNSYPPDVKFCVNDGARLVASVPAVTPTEPQIYNPFEPKPLTGQTYAKASIGNRLLAALLDGLIFTGLTIPAAIALFFAFLMAYGNDVTTALILCITGGILALIPLAFHLLKDSFAKGQSPGKKALKLMVIDLDTNRPCPKQKSFLRNIISLLMGLIPMVGSFIEPVMVLATTDGKRLGDRAANTMVIETSAYIN